MAIGGLRKAVFWILMMSLVSLMSIMAYSMLAAPELQKPFGLAVFEVENTIAPSDHVPEEKIHVYNDKIIIEIEDAAWARFTDTNSMLPVIDTGANSIEITPESAEQVHVGDIISYKSKFADGIIIHRVVEVGQDADGWFCKVKGDSLKQEDPGKIRFSQIVGIVVGIIY